MALILHHYDFSNFSEKIRLVLGLKCLNWRSVEIPSHLPKPDYTPLTGGYRRTPALQIGADVFCDTHLIARELERRFPQPSIYGTHKPVRTRAMSESLAHWAEGPALWPAALYITGIHADRFPPDFHQDRARLHNKPPPSVEQVRTAGKNYYAEMCSQFARIEAMLDDEHPYILGAEPTLADFIVYGAPWLFETIGGRSREIDAQPRTRAWLERVAAVGHGTPQPLTATAALEIARASQPEPVTALPASLPSGITVGDAVIVAPRDENTPARGSLAHIDRERVIISVDDDRSGHIHVHFPRIGYRVSRPRPASA